MKREEHGYETTDVVADCFVGLAQRSPRSAASVNKKTIGWSGMTAYDPGAAHVAQRHIRAGGAQPALISVTRAT